jgi:nucleosome-remodeling factor subunit BPTF
LRLFYLQAQLNRQKEQLKKDILKKRAVLEKDLQIEIKKELDRELVARTKQERMLQDMNNAQSASKKYISKKK